MLAFLDGPECANRVAGRHRVGESDEHLELLRRLELDRLSAGTRRDAEQSNDDT